MTTDQQAAFDGAWRRLISQDQHALAGANFTPSEAERLSKMYNDGALATPQSKMVFVALMTKEIRARALASEANLTATLDAEDARGNHAAAALGRSYLSQPGVLSSHNPLLGGTPLEAQDNEFGKVDWRNPGAQHAPAPSAAPALPAAKAVHEPGASPAAGKQVPGKLLDAQGQPHKQITTPDGKVWTWDAKQNAYTDGSP